MGSLDNKKPLADRSDKGSKEKCCANTYNNRRTNWFIKAMDEAEKRMKELMAAKVLPFKRPEPKKEDDNEVKKQ